MLKSRIQGAKCTVIPTHSKTIIKTIIENLSYLYREYCPPNEINKCRVNLRFDQFPIAGDIFGVEAAVRAPGHRFRRPPPAVKGVFPAAQVPTAGVPAPPRFQGPGGRQMAGTPAGDRRRFYHRIGRRYIKAGQVCTVGTRKTGYVLDSLGRNNVTLYSYCTALK